MSTRTTATTIIPREQVAENLAIAPRLLIRYEARGLVQAVSDGVVEGYAPAEVRRIWTILSFQRDLGINLAGVEAILKLRDHLAEVHGRLDALAQELRALLEAEHDAGGPADG
jgi:MerR family transcriptional regulator/heat shock protein HspR